MSNDLLPPVVAVLQGEISDFKSKMSEAKGEMASVEGEGKSRFGGMATAIGGGLLAIGGAAVAFGAKSIKTFNDTASSIDDLQDVTGESAEKRSKLQYAFSSWGISGEDTSKMLLKLSKAVGAGSAEFEKYNIATKDAQGNTLPMSDIVANAADVFAKMPDGIDKSNLAMKLFGKSGTDVLDVMNGGAAGFRELGDEAEKYGLVLSQSAIDGQQKNAKSQREMSAAWKGIQLQIGEHLMPILSKLTGFLAQNLPIAIEFVKKVLHGLEPVFQKIGDVIAWLVTWVKAHWTQISATVETAIGYVRGVIETVVGVIQTIWANFGTNILDVIVHVWDYIRATVENAINIVKGIIEVVTGLIHGDWERVWTGIKDVFTGIWDQIGAYVKLAVDLVKNTIEVTWGLVVGIFDRIWGGIKSAFQAVWDGITAIPRLAIAGIKAYIELEFNVIKAIIGAVWDGIRSAASFAWDLIKSAVSGPVAAIKLVIDGITDTASAIWNGLETAATTVWNAVKKAIQTPIDLIKSAIGSVTSAFKSMWNEVAGLWNNSVGKFSFKIPSWVPGLGGDGFDMPNLPTFHTGGTVPGMPGQEVIIRARAGETVRTEEQERALRTAGGGLMIHQEFHGITDVDRLARESGAATAWAIKTRAA